MKRRLYEDQDHPGVVISLNNVATCLKSLGRASEALPLYQKALEMTKRLYPDQDHHYMLACFSNLGGLLTQMDRPREAAESLREAVLTRWNYLANNFPLLSESQKRKFATSASSKARNGLYTLTLQGADRIGVNEPIDPAMGLEGALLSKQLILEALRYERQVFLEEASPQWKEVFERQNELRRQYANLSMQGLSSQPKSPKPGQIPVHQQLQQLADEIERLEQTLRRGNPDYAQQARMQQITVKDVTAVLRPGEMLLEYVRYPLFDLKESKVTDTYHYGVFVVHGDTATVQAIDLGPAEPIDRAIEAFRQLEIDQTASFAGILPSKRKLRNAEARLAEKAAAIRSRILDPVSQDLQDNRRLYVAPDGPLGLIPFEALPIESDQPGIHYLVEDVELVYLSTARDLARLHLTAGTAHSSDTALLIGNPDFKANAETMTRVVKRLQQDTVAAASTPEFNPSGVAPEHVTMGVSGALDAVPRQWATLTMTERFLRDVGKHLTDQGLQVTLRLQEQAVEEAVLRAASPRILQFATHGYYLEAQGEQTVNPLLRSMLILAGVENSLSRPQGPDLSDGLLTAYEVTSLDLRRTELVNLTACQTALDDAGESEGVAGLRSAFLLAGARSVTMSMWEVPLYHTMNQMGDFYQRWLGKDTDTTRYHAFRQAQLNQVTQLRRESRAAHPFYWAGFIYIGDPGDLPMNRQ